MYRRYTLKVAAGCSEENLKNFARTLELLPLDPGPPITSTSLSIGTCESEITFERKAAYTEFEDDLYSVLKKLAQVFKISLRGLSSVSGRSVGH